MDAHHAAKQSEASPFWKLLGIKLRRLEEGYAELHLPFAPHLEQVFSTMHGGALASLLDAAGGMALLRKLDLSRETIRTIELKINYLNPVTKDQKGVIAAGRMIKRGKTVGVSSIEIRDESREIVAIGIGTYAIVPREA